jgi:hypothetical protein
VIVDRIAEMLLAPEVSLRCLDGDVTQQKLNLLQFAASLMARIGRRVGADPICLGDRFGANDRTLPWLQATNSISLQ